MIPSSKWMLVLLQLSLVHCIVLEVEQRQSEASGNLPADQVSENSSNFPMALFVKERSSNIAFLDEPHTSFGVTHLKDDNQEPSREREIVFSKALSSPTPKRRAPTAFVHSSFGGFRNNLVGRNEQTSTITFGQNKETSTFRANIPELENEIQKFPSRQVGVKKQSGAFQSLSSFPFPGPVIKSSEQRVIQRQRVNNNQPSLPSVLKSLNIPERRPVIKSSEQRVIQPQRVNNNQPSLPAVLKSLNIPEPVLVHNFPHVFHNRQNLNQNSANSKSKTDPINSFVVNQNNLPPKEKKTLQNFQQPTHRFTNQNNQFPRVNPIPFTSFSKSNPFKRENIQATVNVTPDVKENQIHQQLPPPSPLPRVTPSPLNNIGQSFVLRLQPSFVLKNATSFNDLQPHNSFQKSVLQIGEKHRDGPITEELDTIVEQRTPPNFEENNKKGKDNIKERDAAIQGFPKQVPNETREDPSLVEKDPIRPSFFGRALEQDKSVRVPRGRSLEPENKNRNSGFVPGELEGGFVPSNFFGTLYLRK